MPLSSVRGLWSKRSRLLAIRRITLNVALAVMALIWFGEPGANVRARLNENLSRSRRVGSALELVNRPTGPLQAGARELRSRLGESDEVHCQYSGAARLVESLGVNLATPAALASGDIDEDGIADLICGYAGPGFGIVTVYCGNPDSIFPNSPGAKVRRAQRRPETGDYGAPSPFVSRAQVFQVPVTPEFLGVGDFDGDGYPDIIAASSGRSTLQLLSGDGRGGFAQARAVELQGRLTAFATGEINRADGLTDIAAAIVANAGPELLVFQGPEGALNATPQVVGLPKEASALVFGQLDSDYPLDLAVAAGEQLLIVPGRDTAAGNLRKAHQRDVITESSFLSPIIALAAGNFSGEGPGQLAVLLADGTIHILGQMDRLDGSPASKARSPLETKVLAGLGSRAARLVRANISGSPADDLVVVDPSSQQLLVLNWGGVDASHRANPASRSSVLTLDTDGEAVAALPMQLNGDALSDLVVLRSGHVAPSLALTPAGTIVVSSISDTGAGSLREAITTANATAGADVITFNIPGPGPFTIGLGSALPPVTEAVTIDATTQTGFAGTPLIEIDGSNAGVGANGLVINAPNCTIRGLIVNRFGGSGIVVNGSGNLVQGNFIGTNAAGDAALANAGHGVLITGPSNTIGGTAAAARNLISGNGGNAVLIQNGTATANLVQGNLIGTNAAGTAALPNTGSGVNISGSMGSGNPANTVVGGTSTGARNIISGNGGAGVLITAGAAGGQIQGNFIGTNISGTVGVGNQVGVGIANASNNIIGGAVSSTSNTVAFNKTNGVLVSSGTGNLIRGNSIFSNLSLGIDLGGDGVTQNDNLDVDTGANNLQNFPVITGVSSSGGGTTVQGRLNSAPLTLFTLEFFSNPACDSSGFGQGKNLIGTLAVSTDVNGNVNFTITFPVTVPVGQFITGTATDPGNNTSEFSQCVQVTELSDLAVSVDASPATVVTGTNISYTIVVSNSGPGPALSVTVTDNLPPQTVFVSCSSTGGGVCGGTGNNRTVTFPSIPAAASATISIVARADCTLQDGTTIRNVVTASSSTFDANPLNNTALATISGAAQSRLDKTSLEFGPVKARFQPKVKKIPSDVFAIESTGCTASRVTAVSISRIGADVDSGKISRTDDSALFSVRLVNAEGPETPIPIPQPAGFSISIAPGQTQAFRVLFNPVIPQPAGGTTGLSANEVLPDVVRSVLSLATNTATITVNLVGRVATAPRILGPVTLTKSKGLMTVSTPIYDANNNVNRVRYQFLNGGGSQVADIEVNVAQAVQQRNLVTGQSFIVIVDFSGDNGDIVSVRVTVFDDEGSSDTSGSANPAGGASPQSLASQPGGAVSVALPVVKLERRRH